MNVNTNKAKAIRYATIEALTNYINHYHNLQELNPVWFNGLRYSTIRTYESHCERLMCEFSGIPMKNGTIPEFVLMHKYFTYEEIQVIFSAFDNRNVTGLSIEDNKIHYSA